MRVLAGGVDSPVRAAVPVGGSAFIADRASGSRIFDVDGNAYIDYTCAYGPVLLGHGDPAVAAAVSAAAESGTVTGCTHGEEVRLAERIAKHVPSMERLRFVSTGTEACMSAVRVARAYTRRSKIVRFAGNYHGHSDEMIFGAGASSNSEPSLSAGVTAAVVSNVLTLEYNDCRGVEELFSQHGGDIAAVIVEPVCANMGLVLPLAGFLETLRSATRACGALLVFDEVITGFRLGLGGAQARYGVRPDLTCLGKVLGGGLPLAAFGGSARVMDVLAPRGPVFQGGTFSGNPLCVAAANALLDRLESDAALYSDLEALAGRLAAGLQSAIDRAGLPYAVVRLESIVDFMFRAGSPHRNAAEARESDAAAYARYYAAMLEQGVFLPPSRMEVMFLTAAHTEQDIDQTIEAAARALA